MDDRLKLHDRLLTFSPNVYYQPPSDVKMIYPCIVYSKSDKSRKFGNDNVYLAIQGYKLTVIDRDPDSNIADRIEDVFQYCSIDQYYTVDNLNHTTLTLYY